MVKKCNIGRIWVKMQFVHRPRNLRPILIYDFNIAFNTIILVEFPICNLILLHSIANEREKYFLKKTMLFSKQLNVNCSPSPIRSVNCENYIQEVSQGTTFHIFHRFYRIFCENDFPKAAARRCSSKWVLLKVSKFHRKHLRWSLF